MRINLQTTLFQNSKISNGICDYVSAILCTTERKTCASMSRYSGIAYEEFMRFMDGAAKNAQSMRTFLLQKAQELFLADKNSDLVIDFTQLVKRYAYNIERLCYDHNGCSNRIEKGLSIAVCALVGENMVIPIDFKNWIQKKICELVGISYVKKNELAKEILKNLFSTIKHRYLLLDGAFATKDFLTFLVELGEKFVMRIASNRVIVTLDGVKAQLREHPALKLKFNQKFKTVEGFYKGIRCFFTAHKRKGKNGKSEIVFIVSNVEKAAKEYVIDLSKRAGIEAFFRTAKQHLGLDECQMLSAAKQEAHILATFLAYVFLDQEKVFRQKKCPEDIIHSIRRAFLSTKPCNDMVH
jgi:hypothetical protein